MIENYKKGVTETVTDYGINFIAVMSIPLSIISFFAIVFSTDCSMCWQISAIPFILSLCAIVFCFLKKRIAIFFRVRIFVAMLFCVGLYTLLLSLLDMASLWFVLATVFAFFDKKTNYAFWVFICSLFFTGLTGFLMMFGNANIPMDYGFENCQFACVSIRIINFLIIGFLVFKILKTFFSTIDLYIKELTDKNKLLTKLKTLQEKESVQQLQNMKLQNDYDKREREITYKRRELKDAFLKIIGFDNALSSIKKSIQAKDYGGALSTINLNESNIGGYDSFLFKFHELYPGFVETLKEQHPKLTQTDIKICVLITSGLKSVEISEILNVSDATVAKYRNRLRKKLEIDPTSDIAGHLLNSLDFSNTSN